MAIEIKNILPGVCKVSVDEDMISSNAANQMPFLLDMLRENKKLEIDLSGVNKMDSVGLKTLLLLRRTASRNHKIFNVIAHSEASRDFINRFQLSDYFNESMSEIPDEPLQATGNNS